MNTGWFLICPALCIKNLPPIDISLLGINTPKLKTPPLFLILHQPLSRFTLNFHAELIPLVRAVRPRRIQHLDPFSPTSLTCPWNSLFHEPQHPQRTVVFFPLQQLGQFIRNHIFPHDVVQLKPALLLLLNHPLVADVEAPRTSGVQRVHAVKIRVAGVWTVNERLVSWGRGLRRSRQPRPGHSRAGRSSGQTTT